MNKLEDRHTIVFSPSSHFCHQRTSSNSIFITKEICRKITITLFSTTNILLFTFTFTNFSSNPFETSITIQQRSIIMITNIFHNFSSYNGFHHKLLTFQKTQFMTTTQYIICKHHTSLVTIHQNPLAFIIFHSNTHTVSIRVRSHNNICINLFSLANSHIKSSRFFRVRTYHCREITANNRLFINNNHILKAHIFQATRNQCNTCTMDRREHNFQILIASNTIRRKEKSFQFFEIYTIHIFPDNLDKFRTSLKLNLFRAFDFLYLIDYINIVWSNNLRTIIPICFVAIIFFRVVRSSKNNTTLATKMTNSKRNLWSRTKALKQIHFNTICREDISRSFSKQTTIISTVMTHNYRNLLTSKFTFKIIAKTLCCSTNSIYIHAVRTHTHNTTKTTCTKFKVFVEALNKLSFIFSLKHTTHFSLCFFVISTIKPFFSFGSNLL